MPLFASGRQALIAGAVVGLIGGSAWEVVEIIADSAFPMFIYNPPLDTAMDMAFSAASHRWPKVALVFEKTSSETVRKVIWPTLQA